MRSSSTRPARSRWPTSSPSHGPATSLVLLGDPQQLDQPLQRQPPAGRRAIGAGACPGRRRDDAAGRGLFLETTWRLHPDLCRFTSEVFYDDRLESEAHLAVQRVDAGRVALVHGTGPRLSAVATEGADNESPEEADRVADARTRASSRAGPPGSTRTASRCPIGWDDILVVAPYNAQVAAIRSPTARPGAGRRDRRQVPGSGGADQRSTR